MENRINILDKHLFLPHTKSSWTVWFSKVDKFCKFICVDVHYIYVYISQAFLIKALLLTINRYIIQQTGNENTQRYHR